MKKSIAYKYLRIVTSVLVTVQLSLGLWQTRWNYSRDLTGLDRRINSKAVFLSTVAAESILNLDFLALENLMMQTVGDPNIVYSIVLDPKGKPLTRFINREDPLIAKLAQNQSVSNNALDLIKELDLKSKKYKLKRATAKAIIDRDRVIGEIWVGYSYKNYRKDFLQTAFFNFGNAIFVCILLTGITLIIFKEQIINPLKKLAHLTKKIANGEFDKRVDTGNHSREIHLLEMSFNKMADRLQETIQGLHQNNQSLAIANNELARATKLKDEFLANMNHELRTPLTTILGLSEALTDEVYGDISDRQLHALTTVNSSGRHLLSLINDLLDLEKIKSGAEKLVFSSVELSKLCEDSLDLIQIQAKQKNIQLENEIVIDSVVLVDERRIKQVLINLLSNAVKFTEYGGKVILKAWLDLEQEQAIFQVIDTGIGIKPEDLELIFTAFTQVESSLSRHYEGSGLGLSLVKNIVELHGGNISVTSEIGRGSQFTIALPKRQPLTEDLELDVTSFNHSLLTKYSQASILLAEDNKENVSTISDYLIAKGYKLVLTHDVSDIVELTKKNQPDLIIIDLQLLGIAGFEVIQQIKEDEETKIIPIIAIAASTTSENMSKSWDNYYASEVDEYICKPFNLKTLVYSIEYQIANRQNIVMPSY